MATPKRNDADGRVAATRLFRLLNPELFIKPNRIVMALGLASVTGLIAYFIVDNQRYQNENAAEMERYRERLRTAQRQRAERMSIEDGESVE